MSDSTEFDFSTIQATVTTENLIAHASELHGVLTGLICSGADFEKDDYLPIINDIFNNGEGLGKKLKLLIKQIYVDTWQSILDDNYGFQLMLPDDDDSIAERSNAIGVWVQGFSLGFGLQQKQSSDLSEQVREVLADFIEISNLAEEVEEDEANEQAYFEVVEYVRISALLCFSELGVSPDEKNKQTTIH